MLHCTYEGNIYKGRLVTFFLSLQYLCISFNAIFYSMMITVSTGTEPEDKGERMFYYKPPMLHFHSILKDWGWESDV